MVLVAAVTLGASGFAAAQTASFGGSAKDFLSTAQTQDIQSVAGKPAQSAHDPHLQTLASPKCYASEDDANSAMAAAKNALTGAGYLVVDAAVYSNGIGSGPYQYLVRFIAAPNLQDLASPTCYAGEDDANAAMTAAEKVLTGAGGLIVDAAVYSDSIGECPSHYMVKFIATPTLQNLASPTRYASERDANAAMAAAKAVLTGAGYQIVDAVVYSDNNAASPYQYLVRFIAEPPSA
jgi:hypothetical protein